MDQRAQLQRQGYLIVEPGLDCGEILRAETEIDSLSIRGAGSRSLLSHAWCRQLGTLVKGQPTVSSLLSKDAVAVQCILFAKSSVRNWLVRMHRDRSFPVKRRTSEADWAGWSWKEGKLFARPPRKIVESLLAVRVHLDETNEQTGALQVVPESHRDDGKVGPRVVCSVSKGGLLVMHPSLLHASSKLASGQRRVLHYVFGPSNSLVGGSAGAA